MFGALPCCGAQSARPEPTDSAVPSDSGRDGEAGATMDAAGGAEDAEAPRPDAGDEPHDCRVGRDCREWWPNGEAFCDLGTCCNGRIDRFGCICGELRGGCPPGDEWCCDDPLHPEIPVGCRDEPCD